ncbi:hypothetical protein T484DRAFT_1757279, partial [Baffinella frigidus]
ASIEEEKKATASRKAAEDAVAAIRKASEDDVAAIHKAGEDAVKAIRKGAEDDAAESRKAAEEAEARRKAAEETEARRKAAEETEARRKAAEEAEARRKAVVDRTEKSVAMQKVSEEEESSKVAVVMTEPPSRMDAVKERMAIRRANAGRQENTEQQQPPSAVEAMTFLERQTFSTVSGNSQQGNAGFSSLVTEQFQSLSVLRTLTQGQPSRFSDLPDQEQPLGVTNQPAEIVYVPQPHVVMTPDQTATANRIKMNEVFARLARLKGPSGPQSGARP